MSKISGNFVGKSPEAWKRLGAQKPRKGTKRPQTQKRLGREAQSLENAQREWLRKIEKGQKASKRLGRGQKPRIGPRSEAQKPQKARRPRTSLKRPRRGPRPRKSCVPGSPEKVGRGPKPRRGWEKVQKPRKGPEAQKKSEEA